MPRLWQMAYSSGLWRSSSFLSWRISKDLKRQLFNRLIALRKANKISQPVFESMAPILGGYSKSTMEEILEVRDLIDSMYS